VRRLLDAPGPGLRRQYLDLIDNLLLLRGVLYPRLCLLLRSLLLFLVIGLVASLLVKAASQCSNVIKLQKLSMCKKDQLEVKIRVSLLFMFED